MLECYDILEIPLTTTLAGISFLYVVLFVGVSGEIVYLCRVTSTGIFEKS
jgi:hypothetical protein